MTSFLPIAPNLFSVVNAEMGVIRVMTPPPSGYPHVVADYKYVVVNPQEGRFSEVFGYVSAASGNLQDEAVAPARGTIITRNMTDYVSRKTPVLTPPNLDRLSEDYYPVIEYYVTTDGEVVFARDFFKYGDIPAKIKVEYETLDVLPRLLVSVTRSGSPHATPSLSWVAMRVREVIDES